MLSLDEKVGFLQKVPLFHSLKRRQLEKLAKRTTERDFKAGQEIVTQGQGGEGFFVLVSGHAEADRQRPDGTKMVVNEFKPTDFFGELALLDDGPRTASVVATEPTACLALTRWDFLSTLQEDSEMSISILQVLAKRFRMTLDTM